MNTRIITLSLSVAHDVSTFALTHGVTHIVNIMDAPGEGRSYAIQLNLINPFLFTKLQDTLLHNYHHDHFIITHQVA